MTPPTTASYQLPRLLPPHPNADLGEDQAAYGLRVLRFILAERHCPATLTDRDLELADDAARDYATQATGPNGRTDRLEPHQLRVLTQFSEVRHWIARSQDSRRQWAQQGQGQEQGQPPQGGKQPGRPAPLMPPDPGKGPGDRIDPQPRPGAEEGLRGQRAAEALGAW